MVWPNGERAYNNKLTWKKVGEIRERIALGDKQYQIARDYGVHPSTISKIKLGQHWKGTKWN